MKRVFKCLVLVCGAVLYLVTFSFAQFTKTVAYPESYRNWVHVKSAIVGPESPAYKRYGGLHHIYANPQAMEGFNTGRFPDGAVIVFDMLETRTENGVTTEGSRRFIDVMQRNSKGFAKTGGWGFEEFTGDSHTERALTEEAKTDCFTCHTVMKERDFVFSYYRK